MKTVLNRRKRASASMKLATLFLSLLFSLSLSLHLSAQEADDKAEHVESTQSISAVNNDSATKPEELNSKDPKSEESKSDEAVNDNEHHNPLDIDVSDVVDAEAVTEKWQESTDIFLEKYDLSASLVGKILASASLLIILIVLVFTGRKLLRWLFIGVLLKHSKIKLNRRRMHLYRRMLSVFFGLSCLALYLLSLTIIWGNEETTIKFTELIGASFSSIFNFGVVLLFVIVLFELVSSTTERYFSRFLRNGSARAKTLIPIVRNIIYFALSIVIGLTLLAELGIDIMPVLAGAGVVGFAIGFGAQTLVKDLITGFIIIIEDLFQIGDIIGISGKKGIVEKITIRKVQLRDLSGSVYTVPFSEISIVENLTKDYSYYMFNIGIAYRESPDEVIELVKSISSEMEADEHLGQYILEPIEILGLDEFADSAIIIKARLKTQPMHQWEVGREFNRRMKYRFDEHDIEIPFPHQTLYFGEDKDHKAPPLYVASKED